MRCVSNQMEGPYKNTYINSIFNYIRYMNFKCSKKKSIWSPPPHLVNASVEPDLLFESWQNIKSERL
jgi:hypothetical protein